MLYLFGRLALSDSLDYSENLFDDDFRPSAPGERASRPEPETLAAAPDRQPRPCPQPVAAGPAR
jgi:hypothetical protein